MARGILGRKVILRWGDTSPPAVIAGVREKSIALNGTPVNDSDGGSDGWRELLAEPGEHTVDISVSGVVKGDALRQAWFDLDGRNNSLELEYPDGGMIHGEFHMVNYNETGPYQDATTFEAEFQSSGPVTYTPAA